MPAAAGVHVYAPPAFVAADLSLNVLCTEVLGGRGRPFLDPCEVSALEAVTGLPFTLRLSGRGSHASADAPHSLSDTSAPLAVPIRQTACIHRHGLYDPAYNSLHAVLTHFNAEYRKAPATTSGVFIVPRMQGGSAWRKELQGFRLLQEYPAATPLYFQKAAEGQPDTTVAAKEHAMQVWYCPRAAAADGKTPPGILISPWSADDDLPRKRTLKTKLLDIQAGNGKMNFRAVIAGAPAVCLMDTGATENFCTLAFAQQLNQPIKHVNANPVNMAGGSTVDVIGVISAKLQLQGHQSTTGFWVVSALPGVDVVLGEPWLIPHRAALTYEQDMGICMIRKSHHRIKLFSIGFEPPPLLDEGDEHVPLCKCASCAAQRAYVANAELNLISSPYCLSLKASKRAIKTARRTFCVMVRSSGVVWEDDETATAAELHMAAPTDTVMQEAAAVQASGVITDGAKIVFLSATTDKVANIHSGAEPVPAHLHAIDTLEDLMTDDTSGAAPPLDTTPVPADVQAVVDDHKDVFQDIPHGLPPARGVSHNIPTEPGSGTPYRTMYRLSPAEKLEVEKQITDLLKRGWIVPSTSPYGAPVLFVQKKCGALRMVQDYRALNAITVKNRYPLPRIDDLLDKLHGITCMTSLDLQSAYHQVRITDEDRAKSAFTTHMGHYEWRVLCFGLSNSPSTFSRVMAEALAPVIGITVLLYMDDVLVISKDPRDHAGHLAEVLGLLRKHKLFVKLSKCSFAKSETTFLGFVVGADGIKVCPRKIEVIKSWPTPQNAGELRSFLGLATYFRKWVLHFSTIAHPLHALMRTKDAPPWIWGAEQQTAFQAIKDALASAPVLKPPNFDADAPPFEVICDASLVAVGAVLTQGGHAIAYESRKLLPAEKNYTTGEIELLAVVHALRTFRIYIEGVKALVVTDHCPLTYLQTQPQLSRRQVRWSGYLQGFDFDWKYRPGKTNPADPLSRLALFKVSRKQMKRTGRSTNMHGIGYVMGSTNIDFPKFIASKAQPLDINRHTVIVPPQSGIPSSVIIPPQNVQGTYQGRPTKAARVKLSAQLANLKADNIDFITQANRRAQWAREIAESNISWGVKDSSAAKFCLLSAAKLSDMLVMLGTVKVSARLQDKRDKAAAAATNLPLDDPPAPLSPSVPPTAKRRKVDKRPQQQHPVKPDTPAPTLLRTHKTVVQLCRLGYKQDPWFDDPVNTQELMFMANGTFMRKHAIVVPNVGTIRTDIMRDMHDTMFGGHVGGQRTMEHVERMFWWPDMRLHIKEHVKCCEVCQRNKTGHQLPAGMLQPLQIPHRPWESVSLDFITQLPETASGNTQIVVFVDRLTKMTHLAAMPTNATALDVAICFRHNVFRLHGLPRDIVSDRDAKFTSNLWTEIFKLLGPMSNMSTAYHPQSDGQTENMNRTLEDMLRHWINPAQDNWDKLLDCAEFAINNAYNLSIKNTPFRLNSGQNPLTPLGLIADTHVPAAKDFVGNMHEAMRSAKKALEDAQSRQKQQYDAKHRHQAFEVGQLVLLRTTNLRFKGPNAKKLLPKWIGPIRITDKVGQLAYKLALPAIMKIHPIFHTGLLKPYHSSGAMQPVMPNILDPEGIRLFNINEIRTHKITERKAMRKGKKTSRKPQVFYLVSWEGYGPEHDSWEPESSLLLDVPHIVQAYKVKAGMIPVD